MWFGGNVTRESILRITWDDQERPSVECPTCDLFALPWVKFYEGGHSGPVVRVNPVPFGEPYTIVDGIRGQGHYVGTAQ